MRWFISDTHFYHANIIHYCDRPFRSVEEMNQTIVDQWVKTVAPEDEVYFVGDVSFGNAEETEEILNQLPGTKHLILGNHDDRKSGGFWKRHFQTVESTRRLFIEPAGYSVTLSHYPMFGPKAPQILIHGHSHNNRPLVTTYVTTRQLLINVSVECIEYTPISETQISQLIEQHNRFFLGGI